jgi:hypothetical protein
VHPAGVAVPSAVLATGIVLFTFVKFATMPVVPPPGGSGPGSVHAPSGCQSHHCLQPRQPRLTGQPALPAGPGQNARGLTGSMKQMAPPLPAAVRPAGPGRAPRANRDPSSHPPGCGLACDAKRVPSSAATAAAGSGGAGR